MKYAIVINNLKQLPEAWNKLQEMRSGKKANQSKKKTERVSFVRQEAS